MGVRSPGLIQKSKGQISATCFSKVYHRYDKPIFISETGHFGSGPSEWLDEMMAHCNRAADLGVKLLGICIYPVTDRPDLTTYFQCGIWDLDAAGNRVAHTEFIKVLQEHQMQINQKKQISKGNFISNENRSITQLINEPWN